MRKTDYIIFSIFILCFFFPVIIEYFQYEWFSKFLENHKLAIQGIQIFSTLGVIISIGLTIFQFNSVQQKQISKLKLENIARLKTLKFELDLNHEIFENEISKAILNKKGNHTSIPESRFYYEVLESALNDGIFIDEKKSFAFWNLFRLMKVCNSLMNQALQILNYEHIVDPRNSILKNGQIKKINQLMFEVEKYLNEIQHALIESKVKTQNIIDSL